MVRMEETRLILPQAKTGPFNIYLAIEALLPPVRPTGFASPCAPVGPPFTYVLVHGIGQNKGSSHGNAHPPYPAGLS